MDRLLASFVRPLTVAVLLFFLLVPSLAAQTDVGSLSGTVVGSDGQRPRSGEATIVDLRRQVALDEERPDGGMGKVGGFLRSLWPFGG